MTGPRRLRLSRAKGARLPEGAVKVDRSTWWGNPWQVWRDAYAEGGPRWVVSRGGEHYEIEPNTKAVAHWQAVSLFREGVLRPGHHHSRLLDPVPYASDIQKALAGKDLACWCRLCARHAAGKPFREACPDCAPCHADVLGAIANGLMCEEVRP